MTGPGGELADPIIDPSAWIAPTAVLKGDVRIGAEAVVMFGAVIRAELDRVEVGSRTNVQDNVVIHCDEGIPTVIGAETTVGHSAVIHGATIGDRCLVGIGALALNGSRLGDGSWLAAGSVLPEGREIPDGMLAIGTPAKPVRELRADDFERQRTGMVEYLRLGRIYRSTSH